MACGYSLLTIKYLVDAVKLRRQKASQIAVFPTVDSPVIQKTFKSYIFLIKKIR